MLELPHTVVGAAIATKFGNPALAVPLAFLSHFVLEVVPHWNPHLYTETKKYGRVTDKSTRIVAIDVATSLIAGTFIAYQALPNLTQAATILAACLAAVLPDVVEAPYFFLRYRHPLLEKWILLQRSIQFSAPVIPGIITQLLVLAAAFWWIFS